MADDVRLTFNNCLKFNEKESPLVPIAKRLQVRLTDVSIDRASTRKRLQAAFDRVFENRVLALVGRAPGQVTSPQRRGAAPDGLPLFCLPLSVCLSLSVSLTVSPSLCLSLSVSLSLSLSISRSRRARADPALLTRQAAPMAFAEDLCQTCGELKTGTRLALD